MREITHFIDGDAFTGASGRFGDVFNPNTGEVQARVQFASAAEMDKAVAAAARTQQTWALVNPQRRARVMFEFKRLIEREPSSQGEVGAGLHRPIAATTREAARLATCLIGSSLRWA